MKKINDCLKEVVEEYFNDILTGARGRSFNISELKDELGYEKIKNNVTSVIETTLKATTSQFQDKKNILNNGVIFIGDIHGQLKNLVENLHGLKLIDSKGDWIANNNVKVIQVGDIIDRGEYSLESIFYLKALQKQIKENHNKSELITLLGNHEAFVLDFGSKCAVDQNQTKYNPKIMQEVVRQGIEKKEYKLVHFDDEKLFSSSHAELSKETRIKAIQEYCDKNNVTCTLNNKSTPEELDIFRGSNGIMLKDLEKIINDSFYTYPSKEAYSYMTGGIYPNDIKQQKFVQETKEHTTKLLTDVATSILTKTNSILWRRVKSEFVTKEKPQHITGVPSISPDSVIHKKVTNVIGHSSVTDNEFSDKSQFTPYNTRIFVDLGVGRKTDRYGVAVCDSAGEFSSVYKDSRNIWQSESAKDIAYKIRYNGNPPEILTLKKDGSSNELVKMASERRLKLAERRNENKEKPSSSEVDSIRQKLLKTKSSAKNLSNDRSM